MRRFAMLMLALLLLVPAARAENRVLSLPEGEYLDDLLADGETLYLIGDGRLYAWREGDDAPAVLADELRLPADGGAQEGEEILSLYEFRLFADGGGLRGLRVLRDDNFEPAALQLCDIAVGEGGILEAVGAQTLALPGELLGEELYPDQVCAWGGALVVLFQVNDGCALAIVDPEDAGSSRVERLSGWDYRLLSLPDGILLADRSYEEDALKLSRLGADGRPEALCALPVETNGLAADAVTGAVFAVLEGRVRPVDLSTGGLGEAVAALPVAPHRGAMLGEGRAYAAEIGGRVAVLETGGRLAEDSVLTIEGSYVGEWLDAALTEYAVAHPELTPVYSYASSDALTGIMTRSPDTDIYVLDLQHGSDYDALLDRGYMLPLDSSDVLAALGERIYPSLLRRLTHDGRLAALPLRAWGRGMGMSERLLEKLGLSADGVPGDWPGFLDFMERELKPRLDRLGEKDRFTYDGIDAASFGRFMKQSALNDFVQCSAAAGVIPDYEDPRLLAVLERLDAIDFTEYGLPEARDGDEDMGYGWSSDTAYLIQFDANYTFDQFSAGDCTPVPLGFGEGLPGVLPLDICAAFVNPYSARAEQAVALLEALSARLPDELLYALCPDLNEPVRAPDFERMKAIYREWIDSFEANVAPQDRQEWEERREAVEREYEDYLENGSWAISEARLAWYRANGDRIIAAVPSWFAQDTTGEGWQLLQQYGAGQLTAREFLAAVGRKARMMAMEEG